MSEPSAAGSSDDRLGQGAAISSGGAPRSAPGGRDLEWEVTHKKSKIHKGRGNTPEAALRDLRDGFAKGVAAGQEAVDLEQKRLDKLTELLGDTAECVCGGTNGRHAPHCHVKASNV